MRFGARPLAAVAAAGLVLAGCSVPGTVGVDAGGGNAANQLITAAVTPEDVAELGPTTLKVWAESADQDTLEHVVADYEKRYPNVTVDVTVKGFDDLQKTVINALGTDDPPDLVPGNQGYGTDAPLVKAQLIRPLDDVVAAYGWDERYGAGTLSQFRWRDRGAEFGTGNLYGISPVVELVGIFYNKAKLAALGLEPPTTFAEFEQDLATAKAAGQQPLMMGNAEQYPATHVFGMIAGAQQQAADIRDWVIGAEGATFDSDANREAAAILRQWTANGYFQSGYDGLSADDAVTRFADGEGVFLVGGSWYAANLGDDFGFIAPPAGVSGKSVAIGATGLPWHISSKTKKLPAAVAFLAMLEDPELAGTLVDLNRIPIALDDVDPPPSLVGDEIEAARRVLADDGLVFYYDWSTDTMLSTLGGKTQEFMAGLVDTAGFLGAVQTDWTDFQEQK